MRGQKEELNSIVAQRVEVSPGLIILRAVPDGWALPGFESGQFAVLGLPGTGETGYIQDVWQRVVREESSEFRASPDDTHVFPVR